MKICPKCQMQFPDETKFCSNCGTPLETLPTAMPTWGTTPAQVAPLQGRPYKGYTVASGVLSIISACYAAFIGIIALSVMLSPYSLYVTSWYPPVIMILSFLAFAFGLTAGILTLKRRLFPLVVIGISLLIVTGAFGVIGLLGIPLFILSVLSMIFVAVSRKAFIRR